MLFSNRSAIETTLFSVTHYVRCATVLRLLNDSFPTVSISWQPLFKLRVPRRLFALFGNNIQLSWTWFYRSFCLGFLIESFPVALQIRLSRRFFSFFWRHWKHHQPHPSFRSTNLQVSSLVLHLLSL